jgi:beta-lactam-binding protein with PASTA domain
MKKNIVVYISVVLGSFLLGFGAFYYIMPIVVRHSRTIEVPYLKNMSLTKAKSFLTNLDLQYVIIDSVNSIEVAKGFIVSSDPPAKEEVKVGSVIKLVISKGPRKVRLPNIVGLSRKEALDSLDAYGITNRVFINYPVQEKRLDKRVVKTKPAIEDSIPEGSILTIYLGTIKRKVFLMPNLNGMRLDEARAEIAKYGLTLGEVKRAAGEPDVVIQQSPSPGIEVTFGDYVKLVVGR